MIDQVVYCESGIEITWSGILEAEKKKADSIIAIIFYARCIHQKGGFPTFAHTDNL